MIKTPRLYFFVIVTLLLAGCQITETRPTTKPVISTSTPMRQIEATLTIPRASTTTPNIPAEARLKSQCLMVAPTFPTEMTSNGVIVLSSRVSVNNRYKRESYLFDIKTQKTTILKNASSFIVSPDKTLLAYKYVVLDTQDRTLIVTNDLVITNTSGQSLKVLSWKKDWVGLQDWVDNQRLLLMLDEDHSLRKPFPLLVLNPFTGEQQILRPDFPKFLDVPGLVLPYWEKGRYGVLYDPMLTRVIYPRFIGDDQKMYTYALWDVPEHKMITSLEDIFSADSIYNDIFPMPHWSPDGSQFVFSGLTRIPDAGDNSYHVENELYRVNRDGQVQQLTHLYSFAGILDSMSWSPDGRYLAGFLVTKDIPAEQVLAMVLDMKTLGVVNYCIPITHAGDGYGGGLPPAPVWSPDGKQFLIVDWYEKDHRRVILVDIAKGMAAEIAQDMQPMGWMLTP